MAETLLDLNGLKDEFIKLYGGKKEDIRVYFAPEGLT